MTLSLYTSIPMWILSETHKKLELEYCTFEKLLMDNQDPNNIERYSEQYINKATEYDNAKIAFIDNYIFSRI